LLIKIVNLIIYFYQLIIFIAIACAIVFDPEEATLAILYFIFMRMSSGLWGVGTEERGSLTMSMGSH